MIQHLNKFHLLRQIKTIFFNLIAQDKSFLWLAMIYAVGISLLTLAVPVCVQLLINSVAYVGSTNAVIVISILLLFLLICSGALYGIQYYILEIFERRIYVRLSSEITLNNILTDFQYSENTDKSDLVNRYFDIMTLQKNIPTLIVDLFAFFLQGMVGIVVVSSYHPYLLLFNICFTALVWIIWRFWGYDAMLASVEMSDAKYQTAKHIENIARNHNYFSSHSHSLYAISKADTLVKQYIGYRKRFFGLSFRQQLAFLLLYAFASAGLLGIGGVIVINEQLTLGQLVAAELILSAVFYNVVRLGYTFKNIYELGAAVEEIDRIYQMPFEESDGKLVPSNSATDLHFNNTEFYDEDSTSFYLDLKIPAGNKLVISCQNYKIQQSIIQSVTRRQDIKSGQILLGNDDIRDLNPRMLRDTIAILDRLTIFETSIRDYLMLDRDDIQSSEMYAILELLELRDVIDDLDHGLDTKLSVSGSPLSPTELLRLKLAALLMLKPQVIILTQLFDMIPYEIQNRIFQKLKLINTITIIYFSNRIDNSSDDIFDDYLYISREK